MGDLEKATRKAQEFRQREQEILDAALILFLEQGEDRVTVENIADRVGIGKGTIYKHFETKNQIYLLLMLRYEEDLASLFQDISESDDKETLAREYFRFRISDPARSPSIASRQLAGPSSRPTRSNISEAALR